MPSALYLGGRSEAAWLLKRRQRPCGKPAEDGHGVCWVANPGDGAPVVLSTAQRFLQLL